MRHGRGLLIGLLTATMIGCTSGPTIHTTAWLDRFRQGAAPAGPDVVQMDVALVERPLGDRLVNDKLWELTDEQIVDLEHRAVLQDSGFRVGQVGGMAPPELQNLLTSERSCAAPRRLLVRAGEAKQLTLGPAVAQAHFRGTYKDEPETVTLDQAEFNLDVVAKLTPDGQTRLHFVPVVKHGEVAQVIRPAADRSGLMMQTERPAKRYECLDWEVTLAPNEYVVIGGRYDLPETLGHACFVRRDEAPPVQRLLVIRTARAAPVETPIEDGTDHWVPPLALQAQWTATARGTAP
jgi:hypothetical protein